MNNRSKTRLERKMVQAEIPTKYGACNLDKNGFMFPRVEIRDRTCLNAAFEMHGHRIADIHCQLPGPKGPGLELKGAKPD
jgi:hypothetical protein